MKPVEKIILGTVQFGLDYGINNLKGKVSPEEILSILTLAYSSGIKTLDTACDYGDSELALGNAFQINHLDFNIVSKYPKSDESVDVKFNKSLSLLGCNTMYAYLVHEFDNFKRNPSIWDSFIKLKAQNKVSKIGFSLYNVDELRFLLDNHVAFEILQVPYNIFDRQFEPYFETLKKAGVVIYTRSAFLQGLFFKPLSIIGGNILSLKPYLEELHAYCSIKDISIEHLALNYVVENPYIDGVLIGVDCVDQLQKDIDVLSKKITRADIDFIHSIKIKESDLLSPVNWK